VARICTTVAVGDSKVTDGSSLMCTPLERKHFIQGIKAEA
jgi:hypothetical protein